jgi:hypothetical protein
MSEKENGIWDFRTYDEKTLAAQLSSPITSGIAPINLVIK